MRSRKSDAMKEEAEIILAQLRAAASRSLERVADTFKRWDADYHKDMDNWAKILRDAR
jgi:hypothetical protein